MRPSRAVIFLLIALALLQAAYFGSRLPDPVVSKFNAAGQPSDWMSRGGFLAFNLVMLIGMGVLFLALPPLISKVPNEWINLPRKEYWLAPERRAATLDQMARRLEWMGAGTLAFLLGITQLTIDANLREPVQLGAGVGALTTVYLVLLVIWAILFLRWSYQKPPQTDHAL